MIPRLSSRFFCWIFVYLTSCLTLGVDMCGIAGIVHRGVGSHRKEVLRMLREEKHRGPDDWGVYEDKTISLGQRRLSIIDLSSAGKQPMSNEDGSVWIVFNGEVYNFKEIKQKLKKHRFKSHSDTEAIIHACEEWGIPWAIEKFVGMFAFALYDSRRKKLFLVRDRFGVKPLYYALQEGRLLFASEIKAMLALNLLERSMNRSALWHYLSFLSTPAPQTLFEGVYKVPAGFYLEVDLTERTPETALKRYWSLEEVELDYSVSERAASSLLERLFLKSMEYRMVSDVPVGVFLSGGLDSSIVAAMAHRNSGEKMKTFNVSFDIPEFDESKWARLVSEHLNTEHHEVHIGKKDAMELFGKLAYIQDEPIADPVCLPLYYLSRAAHKQGIKVIQVGEGGDEAFCGYLGYELEKYRYRVGKTIRRMPSPARRVALAALKVVLPVASRATAGHAAWPSTTLAARVAKGIQRSEWLLKTFVENELPAYHVMAFNEDEKVKLAPSIKGVSSYAVLNELTQLRKQVTSFDGYLARVRLGEYRQRLPELLLMRLDKFLMRFSVEGREPFLDHRLVWESMRIPSSLHMLGEKKHLMKMFATKYLPKEVVYRKKVGFGVPVDVFMRDREFRDACCEALSGRALAEYFDEGRVKRLFEGTAPSSPTKVWALVNFALWHKTWISSD